MAGSASSQIALAAGTLVQRAAAPGRTVPVPVLPAIALDGAGTSLVACHLADLDVPALVEQSGTAG